MTAALSSEQRTSLERLVGRARTVLEEDLEAQASGRFGIDADGVIASESTLRLSPADLFARRELVAVVEHLRSEGEDEPAAVARFLREAVFTHLNRLIAIRIAEELRLLPPSLADGRRSQGFRDVIELAPLLAGGPTGGYWTYLQLCADELAPDVPTLFDPRNPLLALVPSPGAVEDLVDLLSDRAHGALWAAPDCLGWVYQFFNTPEERRAMREGAPAPRNSRELAVRNQFFTPRYVVDFLVQNSLGRRLIEADPSSPLAHDLPLLVDIPTERGEPLDLADVSVLDPAVGSGHFLLAAYDVLEQAWEHTGVPPADAAPHIVQSLWGIDIDPRCAQVASAAVIFRARRASPHAVLPRPNIICARALPAGSTGLDGFLAVLSEPQQRLVRALSEALEAAPVLGPLLKVEERLASELRGALLAGVSASGTLADAIPDQALADLETELIGTLHRLADATQSTAAERLLAAEAEDAVRLVHALQRRYDAVVMNPPFGEPVPSTKTYLRAAFPWIPATSDLFAAFVGRGLGLCKRGGHLGAITSRVGMFLSSFEAWRSQILLGHELVVVADLGEGVMEQAMVEAAAYVLVARPASENSQTVFIRAVGDPDRARAVAQGIAAYRQKEPSQRVFIRQPGDFAALDSSPIAYWADEGSVARLVAHAPFEPSRGVVRQGLATGDDFRFVRAWWEVDPRRLTRGPAAAGGTSELTQLTSGARWAPIVKSGSSQPWFSPILLVVDWEGGGERLRTFTDESGRLKSRPQNTDFYFRAGFSWTRRATRLVPYIVPSGCIPSVSRYQAFPAGDPFAAVALVASNVATAFCRFYGEKFLWPNFLVDNLKNLPSPEFESELLTDLAAEVGDRVAERREAYTHLEPYREFVSPAEAVRHLQWDRTSLLGPDLDRRVAAAYGLSTAQQSRLELDMREALGLLVDVAEHGEGDEDDIEEVPPWGQRIISYLVGSALGRWDIRIGRDPGCAPPLGGPFDPLPVSPPGMLVGQDGLPHGQAPAGYPLAIPESATLVDEPGHPWDIEQQVTVAASALFDEPETVINRALAEVRKAGIRQYLRTRFFRDHLALYSKGRRKAPIYWPLYVASGDWGVWIYAPHLSRETLYAVTRAAADRLEGAEAEIRRLQRERGSGGAGRTTRVVANALETEERLAEELRRFREEAERIASLGWEPDLDDGILLCAAPLANLFPAWRDAAVARKEIKADKYPWAAVSKWADQL